MGGWVDEWIVGDATKSILLTIARAVLCCSTDVVTGVDVQDVAVVMFVVVGSDRIGSQRNATDPTRPSVCGWLAPTAPSVTYQDIKIR